MGTPLSVAAFAKGLLSLLDSQDRGVGLKTCSDMIQPPVVMGQMLGMNDRNVVGATAYTIAATVTLLGEVPAGEVWILRHGGLQFINPAGATTTEARIVYIPPEASHQIAMTDNVTVAPSTTRSLPIPGIAGLMFNPGTRIYLRCTFAGAPTLDWGLYYDRLKV